MALVDILILTPMVGCCMISLIDTFFDYETDCDEDTEVERKPRPTVVYSSQFMDGKSEEEKRCSICLCEYEDGEMVVFLDCLHFFHHHCIDPWIPLHRSCPICRFWC